MINPSKSPSSLTPLSSLHSLTHFISKGAWDWGNFAGFFWAGLALLCAIYTYFRVPEPRGRTFAELDLLFERKVSARKFAKTEVDVFDETVDDSVVAKIDAQYAEKAFE